METIITFIIAGITGYVGYIVGKREIKHLPKEDLTPSEVEKRRQKNIEKSFQKLFEYNENVATRGYRDE